MRPDALSVTQITTYLMCPRKYRFRYVEKREAEERRAEMALGSAVHSAIAWWLEARIDAKEPTLEEVLRTFRADWLAQTAPGDLAFDEGDSPEAFQAQGEALVKLFVERFAGETPPTFAERRFEVDLLDPKTGELLPVKLVGYLDFATEGTEGPPTVGEIKTVARWTSPDQWSLQLAAYSYATTLTKGSRPRVVLVELVKTKTPRIEVLDVDVSERDEAWFCEVAGEVLRAVQADTFFPSPGWQCARCEYRRACRQ